jgi:hypothetical protein
MATNTLSMLAFGRIVFAALVSVTSKCTQAARDTFIAAYLALLAADDEVKAAENVVELATAKAAAADKAQGTAAQSLASRLAGDGFTRSNPFAAFGVDSPSRLIADGHLAQANALLSLSQQVLVHPEVSAETKEAALTTAGAANAMKVAEAEREAAIADRITAVARRDESLPKQFQAAVGSLRTVLRYADYLENTKQYKTVFAGTRKPRAKKVIPTPEGPKPSDQG